MGSKILPHKIFNILSPLTFNKRKSLSSKVSPAIVNLNSSSSSYADATTSTSSSCFLVDVATHVQWHVWGITLGLLTHKYTNIFFKKIFCLFFFCLGLIYFVPFNDFLISGGEKITFFSSNWKIFTWLKMGHDLTFEQCLRKVNLWELLTLCKYLSSITF